ncbi:MAG: DUF4236 domain-containing protein [Chitinophagaceae bacterium]|nr:MAG: DUF4236 domain-containing protein [Chitinophagaceae bacterium]
MYFIKTIRIRNPVKTIKPLCQCLYQQKLKPAIMAWSFRKRIKIIQGVHLNISKRGISTAHG